MPPHLGAIAGSYFEGASKTSMLVRLIIGSYD